MASKNKSGCGGCLILLFLLILPLGFCSSLLNHDDKSNNSTAKIESKPTTPEIKDVIVPNLVNMKYSEAEKAVYYLSNTIDFVGKDVTPSNRKIWDSNNWIVCSQNPDANTTIKSNGTITVLFGRDKNECDTKIDSDAEKAKQAAASQSAADEAARKSREEAQASQQQNNSSNTSQNNNSSATTYANCASLNKDYPHGVGRSGASDSSSSKNKITNFTINDEVYNANSNLDRDKDGIACEK